MPLGHPPQRRHDRVKLPLQDRGAGIAQVEADRALHPGALELDPVGVLGELPGLLEPGLAPVRRGRRLQARADENADAVDHLGPGPRRDGLAARGRQRLRALDGQGRQVEIPPRLDRHVLAERLAHLVPDGESIPPGRHVADEEPAVGPADAEPGGRAHQDIAAHVRVDVAREPDEPRLFRRERPELPRAHRLVERVARRKDVDVVRLGVVVAKLDRLAERDRLHARDELQPPLVHQRDVRLPPGPGPVPAGAPDRVEHDHRRADAGRADVGHDDPPGDGARAGLVIPSPVLLRADRLIE